MAGLSYEQFCLFHLFFSLFFFSPGRFNSLQQHGIGFGRGGISFFFLFLFMDSGLISYVFALYHKAVHLSFLFSCTRVLVIQVTVWLSQRL